MLCGFAVVIVVMKKLFRQRCLDLETHAAVAQWIDTVFEAVDLDGWDDLCDRGYDGGLLEAITTEFFERQKAEGFQQCESWDSLGRKAAFLYGYRLGQAAQGEKPR